MIPQIINGSCSLPSIKKGLLNSKALEFLTTSLKPLTSPYTDRDGRIIQIWFSHCHNLIGAVLEQEKMQLNKQ